MTTPLAPPPTAPPAWSPWEARTSWHDAALLAALVLAPEALRIVEAHVAAGRAALRPPTVATPRSRPAGRRPGVRPPRSC